MWTSSLEINTVTYWKLSTHLYTETIKCELKSGLDVVMFHCRLWLISRWRCWSRCWWGRSCCFIQVTMRMMMIAANTSAASPLVLSDGHSQCCRQCALVGGRHSVAGRSHRLVTGSAINWGDWLNVSVQYRRSCCNTGHECDRHWQGDIRTMTLLSEYI